jgi:hypothetical protein
MINRSRAGDLDRIRWLDVPTHRDDRGALSVLESGLDLPFEAKRIYFLHDIVADRGGHAHRETEQVVIALHGALDLTLHDGRTSRTYHLDRPDRGLLLVPMLFITMTHFTPDTRMLVIASNHYDSKLSIRSWTAYLQAIAP